MDKNIRRVILLAITFFSVTQGQQRSKTFLSALPPFQSGSPLRESLIRFPTQDNLSFLQVVPFGGHSTNPDQIAEFFLPAGKSTLLAAEDLALGNAGRDLSAAHFNIKTKEGTFKSDLIFKASHQFAGVGLAYRQQFAQHWWFEAGTPFVRVEQSFRFKERIINTGGGAVRELGLDNSARVGCMTAGFKQENWRFGKIDKNLKLVQEGFADLELKLGYQAQADEKLRLYGYAGFVVPTGNKPCGQYVFEPMVGNNGHVGFLYGSHIGISAWCRGEHAIAIALDFNTRYLFRNTQIRSFDLKDKEFSRYIETYKDAFQAELAFDTENPNSGTSGINVFTHPVKVFPGVSLSILSAMVYTYRCLAIEAGYYFYARQAERIEVPWRRTSAVKDVGGLGQTNRARTIREDFEKAADPFADYQPLIPRDIDAISPASPALLSFIGYLTLGYYVTQGDCPVLLGIGASYQSNASRGINQWATWGKIAVEF